MSPESPVHSSVSLSSLEAEISMAGRRMKEGEGDAQRDKGVDEGDRKERENPLLSIAQL